MIFLNNLFHDQDIIHFLKVNRYENVLWFNKEAFDHLMWWLFVIAAIHVLFKEKDEEKIQKKLVNYYTIIKKCLRSKAESGYQVEKLMAGLNKEKGK